jgi:hypothetical protein
MSLVVDWGTDALPTASGAAVSTTLVLNPRHDARFVALAEEIASTGTDTPLEFQERLRRDYPNAVVRARELTGEAFTIWYVYRDGHWIPSPDVPSEGG